VPTPLPPERLAVARAMLLAERAETLERLHALEADVAAIIAASEGSNADDEHDPEGSTIAFERAQTDALAQQAVRHLAEVAAALGRVDDGSWGTCVRCGGAIPDARLEARPTATTHVECA
jgi:DnaK suppressor protein